jgi:hypothetical protein
LKANLPILEEGSKTVMTQRMILRYPIGMTVQKFSLFASLIPTWRFFDQVGDVVQLYYQIEPIEKPGLDETNSSWILFDPLIQRRWFHLFFNPKGNLKLAQQSLIQRFAQEGFANSVTLQMVQRLVLTTGRMNSPRNLRFKIILWPSKEEIYRSHFFSTPDEFSK